MPIISAQSAASTHGTELDYAQITTNASISGTSSGSPSTVVTGNAVSYDGNTPIIITFYSPGVVPGTTWIQPSVYEGTTHIAVLAFVERGGANMDVGGTGSIRITPSAGSHTYSIKAWVDAGTGTVTAGTGGGSGANAPAYIRITQV